MSNQSVTSPARPSVLPDAWIEKLFQKFEDFYGAKWAAQYGDFPRDRVKRTWAEELGGFADMPGAIAGAISAQKSGPFPPTLPEFLSLCRAAGHRIGNSVPALEYKPTSEDLERASKAAESAVAALKPKLSDGIDKHWATHPRTQMHLDFIFGAAKRDERFKPCIEQMVSDGICTAEGKLLKTYRAGEFA
jgi:hypothetical protein